MKLLKRSFVLESFFLLSLGCTVSMDGKNTKQADKIGDSVTSSAADSSLNVDDNETYEVSMIPDDCESASTPGSLSLNTGACRIIYRCLANMGNLSTGPVALEPTKYGEVGIDIKTIDVKTFFNHIAVAVDANNNLIDSKKNCIQFNIDTAENIVYGHIVKVIGRNGVIADNFYSSVALLGS